MAVLDRILQHKLVAILRGVMPADILRIAQALQAGGVRILEITLNSPDALAQIKQVEAATGDALLVGAGTVLHADDAKAAIAAGAQFLIAPLVDAQVIRLAKDAGVVVIPGAYTPTEIYQAHAHGADLVKVFPVSDAAYIKAVRAPLPHIRLMPTGGVTLGNVQSFLKAGAVAVGVGSALLPSASHADDAFLKNLTARAAQFVQAAAAV